MTALNFSKGVMARVMWPLDFLALDVYSFKMVKAMDFVFGRRVSMDSLDMTP